MKKNEVFSALLLAMLLMVVLLSGCVQKTVETGIKGNTTTAPVTTAVTTTAKKETTQPNTTAKATATNIYQNTQYCFNFTLPNSWKGYSIVTDKWQGTGLLASASGKIVETGPIISIRHPLWTSSKPRQDIPIMVFTLPQWASLQKQEFSVGAAPIPPSELGRNSQYVFALPARYNYSFLTGYEEVANILNGNPLKPY